MKELLEELAKSKLVRITGSFADGTQNDESDIDFKVKEDHPENRGETNIQKVAKIVERHGVKMQSTRPGYIFSHKTSGNGYLPRQIEFYDYFEHRPNRMKEIEVEGVKFKTW